MTWTMRGLEFTDEEVLGHLLMDQVGIFDCSCGWPVTWFQGRWLHVINPELCGTDDHDPNMDDDPNFRACIRCGIPIKDDPEATYKVIGLDESLCCEDYLDDCPACQGGEAHPHEPEEEPEDPRIEKVQWERGGS